MAAALRPSTQLFCSDWDQFENLIARFEDAWQHDARPALAEYLSADSDQRLTVLIELIHTDLEYRLKAGEAVRVETYLQQYPELAAEAEAVIQLIGAEFSLRCRREGALTVEDYQRRFPQFAAELAGCLPTTPFLKHPSKNEGGIPYVPGRNGLALGLPAVEGSAAVGFLRVVLAVTQGPHQGRVFTFTGHDTFLVGRSKQAHFRLPKEDDYFSRIHFLVEVKVYWVR